MAVRPDPVCLPAPIADWLAGRGWHLRAHQARMLELGRTGQDALLVAATGSGKTLSGFLCSLAELADAPGDRLHTLYVSPLKALGEDIARNLEQPIAQMGLGIVVETRTGDTSAAVKQRQRGHPPHILLTTPESLSLLLAHEDAPFLFAGLRRLIVDELHAFASGKRGDLLALSIARLQRLAPHMRRVGLSATIGDAGPYRAWLARDGRADEVALVRGEPGAAPDIHILIPDNHVPWAGHAGRYAVPQVYAQIARHRLTLVFCNTRSLAELMLQDLWAVNDLDLPIAIHHGSLSQEVRRKVEHAVAQGRLRALVCTASLDLGVDWADVDLVIQMGAPKGASRLVQRIGRANHRLDEPSKAIVVPGNRFEYLEAQAALDAIAAGELDCEHWREGALDVLAQHVTAMACAGPFEAGALFDEVRTAAPYAALSREQFDRVLAFVAHGGYALAGYDRYNRLRQDGDGLWHLSHPNFLRQHRMNAGIIVDAPTLSVRFRNGRTLGHVEESFAAILRTGDTFRFSGLALEVEGIRDTDLIVRATSRSARIPSYMGARMALTTHLADKVRRFLHEREQWPRFPPEVREWLEVQGQRSILPAPDQLLVETFPHNGIHHMVAYSFEGWNAHQSLGMLLTRRMESAGLQPLGFVANDYALAVYGLQPIADPAALFGAEVLEEELADWVQRSHLLKRAFREVAVIGGLVERQHPGRRKSGRQVTFSTDLIFDMLCRHEPDHVLLRAAWDDARTRLVDVARLTDLLARAQGSMVHVALDRVSPLAVPALVMIGREHVAQPGAENALLIEAEEELAAQAMRTD